MLDGILIIDKPEGLTSHDVVARCRRILRTKKIGHTGTLDPFATGVMVVLVGRATRLAQFLDRDAKEYEALVRFGFETDSGDRTGVKKEGEKGRRGEEETIGSGEIEAVLGGFRGEILQTPPMYSAKKVAGKKLYELARKGIEIERQPVRVNIYELELSDEWRGADGAAQSADSLLSTLHSPLKVVCSAGTYIRVLAEDIGRALGTGAHLAELRRTRAGKFGIERAVTLERLEELAAADGVGDILVSMNDAVAHLGEVRLSGEEAAKIRNGMKLKYVSGEYQDGATLRLTADGELLAIGFYEAAEKIVQPRLVLV
ncbi:MAG: tRNA pseudouridine(55) synthase TruB [Acidobacteria bacterium]|nr:tRNA pseudouridine(55) synthase TruB [Acidobacteriota bacterium]